MPGHVGCSRGFNSMLYKPHNETLRNTSGREQIHSLLEDLRTSFRQMSYPVFMTMHRVFYLVQNLKKKNIIKIYIYIGKIILLYVTGYTSRNEALCSNISLWEAVPNTLIDHFGNQVITHQIYPCGSSA